MSFKPKYMTPEEQKQLRITVVIVFVVGMILASIYYFNKWGIIKVF